MNLAIVNLNHGEIYIKGPLSDMSTNLEYDVNIRSSTASFTTPVLTVSEEQSESWPSG